MIHCFCKYKYRLVDNLDSSMLNNANSLRYNLNLDPWLSLRSIRIIQISDIHACIRKCLQFSLYTSHILQAVLLQLTLTALPAHS